MVKWVIDDAALPGGRAELHPFSSLPVTDVFTERHAVWVRLRTPVWREFAPVIRCRLLDHALDRPAWHIVPSAEVVRLVAEDILSGDVGKYVDSHGGSAKVEVADVDSVRVRIAGACSGCPLKPLTFDARLGGQLAERLGYPVAVEVETA